MTRIPAYASRVRWHETQRGAPNQATTYYLFAGKRVAMRDSGLANNPYFLLGDHLGSTSITADTGGAKVAELRHKAWGENRYSDRIADQGMA